jgi:FtsP/CotA-like multicopper oxidase with cupredoxin domain
MKTTRKAYAISTIAVTAALLTACASSPLKAPTVPAALMPPAGQTLYMETLASGVQIYECSQKPDSSFEWAFKGPEAALTSRAGKHLGKHYGGPTWESTDGSTVVAELKARDPGPNPSAIPWLLLGAKSNTGNGVFSATKSIQRIDTVGGTAPAEACKGANLNKVARVPYTATYYFYK